jgi:ABC-type multidrug transport system ATPase subunit
MRITSVRIDNFKSLVGFDVQLDKFTCLIGLNGSGKSTVLQAIDFLAQLFRGDVSAWLNRRQWKSADLSSSLRKAKVFIRKSTIMLSIDLAHNEHSVAWQGTFNRTLLRCTHESLVIDGREYLRVGDGALRIGNLDHPLNGKIGFTYEGSVLSQLKDEAIFAGARTFKKFMAGISSLDLLAPQLLRKRSDKSYGEIGLGGERLSAFIHEMTPAQRASLLEQLQACYPSLRHVVTKSLRAGWKQLSVGESFGRGSLLTEAGHINDGMLRLMAILAETLTQSDFLLFDEIENGINPELVEILIGALIDAPQQVLVTTHSPMILNWLEDDVARAGVQYLYRTEEGYTRAIPFFSIPSLAEKLEVMGPGEAFVDTQLSRLTDEIAAMKAAQQGSTRADPR